MELGNALSLKESLLRTQATTELRALQAARNPMYAASILAGEPEPLPFAAGIGTKDGSHCVEVRIQDFTQLGKSLFYYLKNLLSPGASEEVNFKFIGPMSIPALAKAQNPDWLREKNRPLRCGASVGHYTVTAGTTGAFVKDRKTGEIYLLSNNHVLAAVNEGSPGDAVLQPGSHDGGSDTEQIGTLKRFVEIKAGDNDVDCAISTLSKDVAFTPAEYDGIGKLKGVVDIDKATTEVAKIGRTTGTTNGRIVATQVDGLKVNMGSFVASFNNQIEITGDEDFSAGGDSGSLIIDGKNRACGLLFAGSPYVNRTFACEITRVLDNLDVDLVL